MIQQKENSAIYTVLVSNVNVTLLTTDIYIVMNCLGVVAVKILTTFSLVGLKIVKISKLIE